VRHHTRSIRGDPQIIRPRRRPHLGSASLVEKHVGVAMTSFPCRSRHFRLSTRRQTA
jgi:hypothetical protein